MSTAPPVEMARFTPQSGASRDEIPVLFNPVSLQYSVTNTLENKGSGNAKKQYVAQSTGKLSMELVFDTTADGQDVRVLTEKLARLMQPDEQKVPAVVLFEWGTYKFQGMVEAYKETIDFFAPSGVPLRAAVSLTLSSQDRVFEPNEHASADTQGRMQPEPVVLPTAPGAPGGAAEAGRLAGNPNATRGIAAANGQESLRFAASASLAVTGSVSLRPPVAFASGGAGLSLGAGAGASAGLSVGAGVGAGVGLSAAAGAAASAGVSASAGAFAGLRASAGAATAKINLTALSAPNGALGLATDAGATFSLGGRASIEGAASMKADVGANAHLSGRIRIREE